MRRPLHVWLALVAAFWLARAAVSLAVFQRADRDRQAFLELAAIPLLQAAALAWLTGRRRPAGAEDTGGDGNGGAPESKDGAIGGGKGYGSAVKAGSGSGERNDGSEGDGAGGRHIGTQDLPLDSGPPPAYKRPSRRPRAGAAAPGSAAPGAAGTAPSVETDLPARESATDPDT